MEDDGSSVGTPKPSGLFDGFEGYVTLSDDQLRSALTNALVVFDTNVLLNLYRYNDQTRNSVIDVIRALGGRFWLPHQVLEEFWRNRERALSSPLAEVQQSVADLEKQLNAGQEIIRFWVNRGALTEDNASVVNAQLSDSFSKAQSLIEDLVDADQIAQSRNTAEDPVLRALEPVLAGRVGQPMDDKKYSAAVAEGERRAACGEPPGFADSKKAGSSSEGAVGDYLVWEQVLCEAAQRSLDVLFVTGDVKRDWWRYEASFPRGPRIELARELFGRCEKRLYMIRPDMLLSHADALAVTVEKTSVEDVERASRPERSSVEDEAETGWNQKAVMSLLGRLTSTAPVQEATIKLAAQQDGYISREDVYRLGDYEPERQLKGFTRPVNRIVQEMRDSGALHPDAADALVPVYDEMRHGFGWVDGFRVPAEVVRIIQTTK